MGFDPLNDDADFRTFEADAVGEFRKYLDGLGAWRTGSGESPEISVERKDSGEARRIRLSAPLDVLSASLNPALADAGLRLAQRAVAMRVLDRVPRERVARDIFGYVDERPSFGGAMTLCRFIADSDGIDLDDLFDGFPEPPASWTAWQEITLEPGAKARVEFGFDLDSPLMLDCDRDGVAPFGTWIRAELFPELSELARKRDEFFARRRAMREDGDGRG